MAKRTLLSASLLHVIASLGCMQAQKEFDLENQTVRPSLSDKHWLIS